MISLYSGTPGSGKSLHVAERIYVKLGAGRPVIANFPVNVSRIKRCRGDFLEVSNDQLTPALLIDFSNEYFRKHKFREDRIFLVIDEAQLLFNAREWNVAGRSEWTAFFTQHRKYGYEIVLVAQFDRMLDRQVRSLLEYEYVHRKVSNFGIYGKLLSLWTLGKLFVAVKVWYPLKEKVGSEWFVCRKKYYSLYDSYARFDAAAGASSLGSPIMDAAEDAPPSQTITRRKGKIADFCAAACVAARSVFRCFFPLNTAAQPHNPRD